ncbi:hypothetical protein EDB86DRAFT_3137798 [Lactarius hatsudake]|nr:hypothetical protein EDB86DRAFT_3137798 [Lactarius hatsudake]
MTHKHWCWDYFVTDNNLYKENKSDFNAWCLGCLSLKVLELAGVEARSVSVNGITGGKRTEQELYSADFRAMADRLIASALQDDRDCNADADESADDDNVSPLQQMWPTYAPVAGLADQAQPAISSEPSHPPPPGRRGTTRASGHTLHTQVPLHRLFIHPADPFYLGTDGLNFYWRGGIRALDEELAAYEVSAGESIAA